VNNGRSSALAPAASHLVSFRTDLTVTSAVEDSAVWRLPRFISDLWRKRTMRLDKSRLEVLRGRRVSSDRRRRTVVPS
jgi:hypothetical protein